MDGDPLLDELGDLLRRADPVPADVTLAARSALAWRRMDAALAELLHDSAMDTEALAGIRSSGGLRALTFETADGVAIDVEISAQRTTRTIIGQITPPAAAGVLVRFPGSDRAVTADDLGRFQVSEVPSGPVSLRCELPEGGAIETGWVTI